jgi:hypothetical protein
VAPLSDDENNTIILNSQVNPNSGGSPALAEPKATDVGLLLLFDAVSNVDAPALAEVVDTPTPVPGKNHKNPTTAGLMSAVIPGSGNFYAAQPLRGVLFAGAFGVCLWQSIENFKKIDGKIKNSNAGQLFGLGALVAYGFGVQDAYDSSNRYNRRYHLKLAFDPTTRGPRLMIARSF